MDDKLRYKAESIIGRHVVELEALVVELRENVLATQLLAEKAFDEYQRARRDLEADWHDKYDQFVIISDRLVICERSHYKIVGLVRYLKSHWELPDTL